VNSSAARTWSFSWIILNYSELVCKEFVYDYRIAECCFKNTKDCFSLLVEFEIQWSGLNYVNQEKVLQSFEENFNPHDLHWIQLIQTLGIIQTMES